MAYDKSHPEMLIVKFDQKLGGKKDQGVLKRDGLRGDHICKWAE